MAINPLDPHNHSMKYLIISDGRFVDTFKVANHFEPEGRSVFADILNYGFVRQSKILA